MILEPKCLQDKRAQESKVQSIEKDQMRSSWSARQGRKRENDALGNCRTRSTLVWATFFGFPSGRWADEVSEQIAEGVHKLDLVEL